LAPEMKFLSSTHLEPLILISLLVGNPLDALLMHITTSSTSIWCVAMRGLICTTQSWPLLDSNVYFTFYPSGPSEPRVRIPYGHVISLYSFSLSYSLFVLRCTI